MSAQDRTEQVLRDIHLMFANSEVYVPDTSKVIVDKKEIIQLLRRLNVCIYELMDEYDLTQRGRDKSEREAKKAGEAIVRDASRKAEDVYAASVIYTDEALHRVQDIMQEAMDSVRGIYEKLNEDMSAEKRKVYRNQSELKGHLQNLVDTEKYLKLIEDSNREIEKEKQREKKDTETLSYSAPAIKPEIKVNTEYFERAGIPLEVVDFGAEDEKEEEFEEKTSVTPEITVNLDAEYFRWKEGGAASVAEEKKADRHTLFSRKDWK